MSTRPLITYLDLIRAEYRESPGLCLTRTQVERLWCLDGPTCEAVLRELLEAGFLRRTPEGGYVRADSGDQTRAEKRSMRRPRPLTME